MRKLLGLAAIGGIGWGMRKLMARRSPDTTDIDMRRPQKTVEDVETATGIPVRP